MSPASVLLGHAKDIVITSQILCIISEIDEFKGSWKMLGRLSLEKLSILQRTALIQSAGAVSRMGGFDLTDEKTDHLLNKREIRIFIAPDEQYAAGYAEVLRTIFNRHPEMNCTPECMAQLHCGLLQYERMYAWNWDHDRKKTKGPANLNCENGCPVGFLLQWTKETIENKTLHPLFAIAIFILMFLEISPFKTGNRRMCGAFTACLLLKAGYTYVPYASLGVLVEKNKDVFDNARQKTAASLRAGRPDWEPWLSCFLNLLAQQKQVLEKTIEEQTSLQEKLPELSMSILEIARQRARVGIGEIVASTKANRNTTKKHLTRLVQIGHLVKHGTGKGSWYGLR